MALVDNAVLRSNKAIGKISALIAQARSYYNNPAMLRARGVATQLANGAWTAAKSRPALIGAVGGGAAGVGYDYATNDRSNLRSMLGAGLKGSAYGSLAGLGYYGYKTYGMAGIRSGLAQGKAGVKAGASKVQNWWGTKVAWSNYRNEFEATGGF